MSCSGERAIFWNLVENLRCHCESQLKCWWWNYRCRLNRWLPLWPHSGGLYSAVPRLLLWWTCDFSAAIWSQRGKSSRQLTVLSSELFKQDNTCKKFYLIHCFISFCALWAEVAALSTPSFTAGCLMWVAEFSYWSVGTFNLRDLKLTGNQQLFNGGGQQLHSRCCWE